MFVNKILKPWVASATVLTALGAYSNRDMEPGRRFRFVLSYYTMVGLTFPIFPILYTIGENEIKRFIDTGRFSKD